MHNSILAVIIVYHPDVDLLRRNINAIIGSVDRVLIWNNSPTEFKETDSQIENEKIVFLSEGDNIGISKALNIAWAYAQNNRYDYMLTMDQDSVWINFDGFLKKVFAFNDINNIFGPEYEFLESDNFREDEYRITSGMFLPTSILNNIGGYCEEFMVDGIDVELCYRARTHGYRVFNVSGSTLEHHPGSHIECNFLNIKFVSDGYSPFRIYGIIRNHMMIFKKYKVGFRPFYYTLKHYYIMMPIKILLGERNKKEKLTAYLKGFYDGLKNTIK